MRWQTGRTPHYCRHQQVYSRSYQQVAAVTGVSRTITTLYYSATSKTKGIDKRKKG